MVVLFISSIPSIADIWAMMVCNSLKEWTLKLMVQSFFDSPLGDKGLLQALHVFVHHRIHLKAESQTHISHLLGRPLVEERLIIAEAIVTFGKVLHGLETLVIGRPLAQPSRFQIVLIVLS